MDRISEKLTLFLRIRSGSEFLKGYPTVSCQFVKWHLEQSLKIMTSAILSSDIYMGWNSVRLLRLNWNRLLIIQSEDREMLENRCCIPASEPSRSRLCRSSARKWWRNADRSVRKCGKLKNKNSLIWSNRKRRRSIGAIRSQRDLFFPNKHFSWNLISQSISNLFQLTVSLLYLHLLPILLPFKYHDRIIMCFQITTVLKYRNLVSNIIWTKTLKGENLWKKRGKSFIISRSGQFYLCLWS